MKRDKLFLFAGILWIAYSLHALISGMGPISALVGAPLSDPSILSIFLELSLRLVLPVVGGALLAVDCLRRWRQQPSKRLTVVGLLLLAVDALVFGILVGNVFVNYVSIVYGTVLLLYALQMSGRMNGTKVPCLVALAVVGTILSISYAVNQTVFPYIEIAVSLLISRLVSGVFWFAIEWTGLFLLTVIANRKAPE